MPVHDAHGRAQRLRFFLAARRCARLLAERAPPPEAEEPARPAAADSAADEPEAPAPPRALEREPDVVKVVVVPSSEGAE